MICDRSDDDLGMESSSDSDASDVDEQMYNIRYIACIAMYRILMLNICNLRTNPKHEGPSPLTEDLLSSSSLNSL